MARVACVQSNVLFGDPHANAKVAAAHLEALAAQGVKFAVFPEAFLTGYCVASHEAAQAIAIPAHHESIRHIQSAVDRLDMMAIVGFAERFGDALYNSAALLEPGREERIYRKVHLPCIGLDRFVEPGNEIEIFETAIGKIGILICFDLRIPEAARTLALKGADILCVPTNWPVGAEASSTHFTPSRAAENGVFVLAANRVGDENGFHFIGRSKICATDGSMIMEAGDRECVLIADIDPALSRNKTRVVIPGEYETNAFSCRRPELYRVLSE